MKDTGRFKERYDFSLDTRQLGIVLFGVLAAAALVFVLGMSVGRQWERKLAPGGTAPAPVKAAAPQSVVTPAPAVAPGQTPPVPAPAVETPEAAAPADAKGIPAGDLTFPKVLTSEKGKTEPLTTDNLKDRKNMDDSRRVAVSKTGGFTVQVGAYTEERTARKTASMLSKKGYSANVRTIEARGGKKLYKVYVGKFDTREEAASVARKIESSERLKPYVTSYQ